MERNHGKTLKKDIFILFPASKTKIKDLIAQDWGGWVNFYTDFSVSKYATVYNEQQRSLPDPLIKTPRLIIV